MQMCIVSHSCPPHTRILMGQEHKHEEKRHFLSMQVDVDEDDDYESVGLPDEHEMVGCTKIHSQNAACIEKQTQACFFFP